jgi:hypothetical protein
MYAAALGHLNERLSGTNQTVAVTRPGRPYISLAKLAKFPLREWNAGQGRFAFYCLTWAFGIINLHECDKVALLAQSLLAVSRPDAFLSPMEPAPAFGLWAPCLEIELHSELHVTRIDSASDGSEIAGSNR